MRGEPPAARDRLRERLGRRCRAAARLAKRLLGAVVIGVAALFVPKTQPDQHWSDPPIIAMIADHDQAVRTGAHPIRPVWHGRVGPLGDRAAGGRIKGWTCP
jgi:hypothetical protein